MSGMLPYPDQKVVFGISGTTIEYVDSQTSPDYFHKETCTYCGNDKFIDGEGRCISCRSSSFNESSG